MKKKKVIKLDVDGMPLKNFIQFMVDKMADIPCNAKIELMVNKDEEPEVAITYYKNECKK